MNDMHHESTIHYSELVEAEPGEPYSSEWNTYVREVGQLLKDGHEAKVALIQGDTIMGVFDTLEAARQEGLKRFSLQPFLVQQIRVREPILRIRGYNRPWPISSSPLAKPA